MLSKLRRTIRELFLPPEVSPAHVMRHLIRQEMDRDPCEDPANWAQLENPSNLRPLLPPPQRRPQ